jgi:hypothetical protein
VDRAGAFTSRRGPGEGLIAGRGRIRQARLNCSDGLAFQSNCRDSSAPKERGPQNDMGEGFLNSNLWLTTLPWRSVSSPPAGAEAAPW